MSQRDSGYARKERDLYETPEWVTEALVPHIPRRIGTIWEPACGSGRMCRVLERCLHPAEVWGCDIEPEGDYICADFLGDTPRVPVDHVDAIITNPPYDLATEFVEQALRRTEHLGAFVAMLLRTDFDHAKSRTHLFRDCPAFSKKLVLMKRIVWFVEDDGKPKASPSFNHAWYVWDWKHEGPPTIAYGP
jgi:methylase of polypeptide subunit release factors